MERPITYAKKTLERIRIKTWLMVHLGGEAVCQEKLYKVEVTSVTYLNLLIVFTGQA